MIGCIGVTPERSCVDGFSGFAFGVRILISLPSTINLTDIPSGTKTITSRGNDYTYNVWEIN